MKDFFSRFRESEKSRMIFPAFLALGVSFLTVAQMNDTPLDMRVLSANVAGGLEQKAEYEADLLMKRDGNTLEVRMGQDAEKVDSVYFTVIGDPTVFSKLEPSDTKTSITMNEPGVALVRVDKGSSIRAGDVVTTVRAVVSGETPLTVVDAGFSSETGEYSLSVKGE